MKIALIAPIEETVPPQKYGGTEWIVYHLAHGLGSLGHQVDLYAAGDSNKEPVFNLVSIIEKSIRSDENYKEDIKLREVIKYSVIEDSISLLNKKDYDIIHNHVGFRFLLFSKLIRQRNNIITTCHSQLSLTTIAWSFLKNRDLSYISISKNQRRDLPDINYVENIYNGIDLKEFDFKDLPNEESGNYLVFLARMSPEKGGIEAVKTAVLCKRNIILAAKVDIVDKPYFEEFNKYINNKFVKFLGEIGAGQRTYYLQNARLLIAPIAWEEPFGLMFTEAMACGTPVVAFARGSVPEVVKDGETGFIVNSSKEDKRGEWIVKKTGIPGLCEAVERIYAMPESEYRQMRKNCRKHVEENFTVEKMVSGYEEVYKKVINRQVTR